MLYIAENTDCLTEDFLAASWPLLSEQRRQKADSLRTLHGKTDCCAVYIMLRYALMREYGIKQAPVFGYGAQGKPFLRDYPHIRFNMSHARNAVCVILSDSETAVDVSDIRPVRDGVIRRVCGERERRMIYESADPQTEFFRMWTRKECLSKLTGEGWEAGFISLTDRSPGAGSVRFYQGKGYVLSYYSEKQDTEIVITDIITLPDRLVDELK